jgi:hypothetical protein
MASIPETTPLDSKKKKAPDLARQIRHHLLCRNEIESHQLAQRLHYTLQYTYDSPSSVSRRRSNANSFKRQHTSLSSLTSTITLTLFTPNVNATSLVLQSYHGLTSGSMLARVLENIFQPWEMRKGDGMGLGESMSRQIVSNGLSTYCGKETERTSM